MLSAIQVCADLSPETRQAPRVLLAEDDQSSRRALAAALRNLGMDVQEVTDGGRLLVSLAEQYKNGRESADIDLIVSDLRMPVCTGLEIFEGIRAARWPTALLLITAYPTGEVEKLAAKVGAKLLVKPFDLEEFERAVLELVGSDRSPGSP
jgi:CheY-like chemotaxis protein